MTEVSMSKSCNIHTCCSYASLEQIFKFGIPVDGYLKGFENILQVWVRAQSPFENILQVN